MDTIRISRVYDHDALAPGRVYLVDRLWPRGVRRDALHLDGWQRDAAPSTELRAWFRHEPARWDEFVERYAAELDAEPEAWLPLLPDHDDVTLLYGARDREHNNAVALRAYLLEHEDAARA